MKSKHLTADKIRTLTAEDLSLKRYIELKELIEKHQEELNSLRADFIHRGTFSTAHYVCTVEVIKTRTAPGCTELVKIFGPTVEIYFKPGERTIVKVLPKGDV